jgi:hypothetical protein
MVGVSDDVGDVDAADSIAIERGNTSSERARNETIREDLIRGRHRLA